MNVVGEVAAGLGALVHIFAFCFETIWFRRPAVHSRFGLSAQDAETVSRMAFNQGFYNLFLAIGAIVGLVAVASGNLTVGRTLILFTSGCMALAGLVLIATDRRFVAAASAQALPALVVLLSAVI